MYSLSTAAWVHNVIIWRTYMVNQNKPVLPLMMLIVLNMRAKHWYLDLQEYAVKLFVML